MIKVKYHISASNPPYLPLAICGRCDCRPPPPIECVSKINAMTPSSVSAHRCGKNDKMWEAQKCCVLKCISRGRGHGQGRRLILAGERKADPFRRSHGKFQWMGQWCRVSRMNERCTILRKNKTTTKGRRKRRRRAWNSTKILQRCLFIISCCADRI